MPMRTFAVVILLFQLLLLNNISGFSQQDSLIQTSKKDCVQEDVFDVFFPSKHIPLPVIERKLRILAIPTISYAPATGWQFGAGASLSWSWGKHPSTRLSAGTVQAVWTTERQFITQIKSNIYTARNLWYLQSDWRLYIFRMDTWGLGTCADGSSYPMLFNWIKFHNILSGKVTGNLYMGLGYHFDYHYNIRDISTENDSAEQTVSPYSRYCKEHGLNMRVSRSSGFSANFVFDSRDNIINPYRGYYVNLNYRYNLCFLGSDQNGSQLWTEFRTYIGLSKKNPRHLLAFWTYGSFQVSGEIPYLDLMASGFDQMNSSGRGYKQGRWRGQDFIYAEAEYRFPISPCSGVIGGVLFANVTTASDRDNHVPLFSCLRPGVGFGIRIMVNKNDRTNILIDFALGQKSNGFYVQAQEIF